jgi:hypothetical protein
VTPSGRQAARVHAARLRPARGELLSRPDVWDELERREATVATVPFWGRAGAGGHTDRIALLRLESDALIEVERWTTRDELCYALEAPVWDRFGTFLGQPLVRGEVVWSGRERVAEIVATRGSTRLEERFQ